MEIQKTTLHEAINKKSNYYFFRIAHPAELSPSPKKREVEIASAPLIS